MHFIRTFGTALLLVGFCSSAQAATAGGHVQDEAGNPLSHVYVHQDGSQASAFTDEKGNFRLKLDPKAGSRLVLSAPDFQPAEVESRNLGSSLILKRSPVATVATVALPSDFNESPLLGGSFGLHYGYRYQTLSYAGNSVQGPIGNALGLGGRARLGNWLWALDADRSRAAVTIPELSPNGGTTFSPETVEAALSLGYVLKAVGGELAPCLRGLYRDVHSNSGGVAYSGTPLDWDQNRQALGIGATYETKFHSSLSGMVDACYFPNFTTFASLDRAPYAFSGLQGGKLKFALAAPMVPGLRVQLGFQHESWGAARFSEDANSVILGISSNPAEVLP